MSSNRLRRRSLASLLIGAAALPTLAGVACAQSAEDFFKKAGQLTLYVGSGAGGGYDQIARFMARNLTRFLPSHPTIVVQNLPTAGGVQASNFIYNSAPRDGSVILADVSSAVALPIYNSPIARYDPRKFEWIGSTTKNQSVCVTWKTTGIKTLEDATKQVVTVSATAINQITGVYPTMLNALLGTKFKVIAGYSTGTMLLAVERGEVEGQCGYSWQTYQAIGSKWFVDDKVNILAQMGIEKIAALPDVPLVHDLLKNPDDQKVFDLIVLPDDFGRPYVAPPGTPADRMAIYRQAFQAVLKDPQALAEAEKQRIVFDPIDDTQVMALLNRAYSMPQDIRDRAAVFAAQVN